jgi:hypothetical protein
LESIELPELPDLPTLEAMRKRAGMLTLFPVRTAPEETHWD